MASHEAPLLGTVAVVGFPNVGKSTLVNRFAGAERVIVSDVAGTTRDAIDLPLEVAGPQRGRVRMGREALHPRGHGRCGRRRRLADHAPGG